MEAGLLQQTFICPEPRFLDYPLFTREPNKVLRPFREVAIGDHIDGWRVCWISRLGQVPGADRGYGGKAKAIPPDANGPARFPGARMIETNRHHLEAFLSGAALFIDLTECKSAEPTQFGLFFKKIGRHGSPLETRMIRRSDS